MTNNIKHKLVKQEDFVASKKLGQNFLFCVNTQKRIVTSATIDPNQDVVIEIGPGFGAITKHLLATNVPLIAIELDKRLHERLATDFGHLPNFTLIQGDVLKIDFRTILAPYLGTKNIKVVANLPYYISSKIILHLLQSMCIQECVIMVQKEMAERISALPGSRDYNGFSALLAYYCQIDYLFTVKPNCFQPAPKVDSAVVKISFFNDKHYDETFDQFLRVCFFAPRKTLLNNLSQKYSKQVVMDWLLAHQLDLNIRPQMLPVTILHELYESLVHEH